MQATAEFQRLADLFPDPLLLVAHDGIVVALNRVAASRLPRALRTGVALTDIAATPADEVRAWLRACARTRHFLPGGLALRGTAGDVEAYKTEGALYDRGSETTRPLILLRLTPREAAVDSFTLLNTKIAQLNEELLRRRRYEATMHEQRERLKVTLESIGDGVIATDMTAKIVLMNPTAQELTGWSEGDAREQPLMRVMQIINEESRQSVDNPVDRAIRTGQVIGLANHSVLVRRDGTEVAIADSAALMRDPTGEPVGVVLVFRDVTEQRALERELRARAQQLEEADRRKDEYLAMLAHELRNPLAPIGNAVHVLQAGGASAEQRQALVGMMRRQVDHLSRLITDLLDVSRVTHGKIALQKQRLDLRTVVLQAVEIMRSNFEARKHSLSLDVANVPVRVDGDAARLTQVVVNLLDNASKYTPLGGKITVQCGHAADQAVIAVRDNGVGIEPELMPHIFELFRQGDTSLDRPQSGLGVGLTLVRTLAELHGGTVVVESAGLGSGAEFRILLPAEAA